MCVVRVEGLGYGALRAWTGFWVVDRVRGFGVRFQDLGVRVTNFDLSCEID